MGMYGRGEGVPMPKKLSDYQIFKREVEKWRVRLGMVDWSIQVTNKPYDDPSTSATTQADIDNRMIQINFSSSCPDHGSREDIKLAGFHEIWEGQFWKLRQMAAEMYSFDQVNKEVHRLIVLLENVLGKGGRR